MCFRAEGGIRGGNDGLGTVVVPTMVTVSWRWSVLAAILAAGCVTAAVQESVDPVDKTQDRDDYLIKQVIWKKCHRKMSPACLKLSLVRTVEMISKNSSFPLAPGVFFSSNLSQSAMPAELARSLSQDQDHAPLDDLVTFAVARLMRSLTLNVNLADFFSAGNHSLQSSVADAFSGRGKGGFGGYGGIVLMLGGSMASMMLAGLAALAGKALMTSMLALMMAALAAMKGGGGGGGEHKTYEVITKPIVSHINTHSSEVQHEHGHHHYRRRSLNKGGVTNEGVGDAYVGYRGERQKVEVPDQWVVSDERNQRVVGSQEWMIPDERKSDPFLPIGMVDQRVGRSVNPKEMGEDEADDAKTTKGENSQRIKRRSVDNTNPIYLTKQEILEINRGFVEDSHRSKRSTSKEIDQDKDSSEVHYSYAKPQKESIIRNKEIEKEKIEVVGKGSERDERSAENLYLTRDKLHDKNLQKTVRQRRNLEEIVEDLSEEDVNYEPRVKKNYGIQPFKYIPISNSRSKRSIDAKNYPDSRIYHIYQNAYDYRINNPTDRDHLFSVENKRYRRDLENSFVMPLAFVG